MEYDGKGLYSILATRWWLGKTGWLVNKWLKNHRATSYLWHLNTTPNRHVHSSQVITRLGVDGGANSCRPLFVTLWATTIHMPSFVILVSAVLVVARGQTHTHAHKHKAAKRFTHATVGKWVVKLTRHIYLLCSSSVQMSFRSAGPHIFFLFLAS